MNILKHARKPIKTRTCKIDRIGLAQADAANLEIWCARFEGDNTIYNIHKTKVDEKSDIVLAMPGDEVQVSFKGNRVVGFVNLSLRT